MILNNRSRRLRLSPRRTDDRRFHKNNGPTVLRLHKARDVDYRYILLSGYEPGPIIALCVWCRRVPFIPRKDRQGPIAKVLVADSKNYPEAVPHAATGKQGSLFLRLF